MPEGGDSKCSASGRDSKCPGHLESLSRFLPRLDTCNLMTSDSLDVWPYVVSYFSSYHLSPAPKNAGTPKYDHIIIFSYN